MDYYELLEISRNASQEVIKNAYRALAKKYHPDTSSHDSEFIERKMREINEAYEVLSNEGKRAIYDQELKEKELAIKQEREVNIVGNSNINDLQNRNNISETEVNNKKNNKKNDGEDKKIKKIIIISVIIFFIIAILTFIIVSIVIEPSYLEEKNKDKEEKVETVDKNEEKETNNNITVDKDKEDYNVKNYNDDDIIDNNLNNDSNNDEDVDDKMSESDNIVKIY